MKRFLIISVLLVGILVLGIDFFIIEGVYIDLGLSKEVETPYKTSQKSIMALKEDGSYEELIIKGVTVNSNIPEKYTPDFAATEEDYYRWLKKISYMGANTVKVSSLLDDDFYNAFYRYNTTHEKPLFLLQGIDTTDEMNQASENACGDEFKQLLIKSGIRAINIIHGKNIGVTEKLQGTGFYFKDISKWVIGYQIGSSWNQDLIAYANNAPSNSSKYVGNYFKTDADANPFEAVMAEVMDEIITYETNKYRTQRIIGFVNDRTSDFLEYENIYVRQLKKYALLDAEKVLPSEKLKSGYFAGYNITKFNSNFLDYLIEDQKIQLNNIISQIDKSGEYSSYLQLLSYHHSMPVICSNFGISTARVTSSAKDKPATEKEQGKGIVRLWEEAMDAKLNGVIIDSWQDLWQRRSWNIAFATDINNGFLWHNLQNQGESYGIMEFCPTREQSCVIDGKYDEWDGETPVIKADRREIFLKYDTERLFLLIKGKDISKTKSIFVPFDITDELGSNDCKNLSLKFNRGVDFLLHINGIENTRLLVQERFDQMRQNFGYEVGGDNPYYNIPAKDSNNFVPILIAQENQQIVDTFFGLSPKKSREIKSLATCETGLLVHGIDDPNSEQYNSLADFSFGDDCVEVGIPWLMLNVSNPLEMKVHKDYYDNYGVETKKVKEMFIGIGDGTTQINLSSVIVKDWDFNIKWTERLKESYDVIREAWN